MQQKCDLKPKLTKLAWQQELADPDIACFYKCNSIYSWKRWKKPFNFAAKEILFQPTILGLKSTQIKLQHTPYTVNIPNNL